MWNAESLSRDQMEEFLQSSQRIEFAGCGREEKYAWVERVLGAHNYGELGKRDRGVVRAYVEKVTGMSVAQTTRLIRTFLDHGALPVAPYQRHCFPTRYTPADIALLAEVDRAHQRLSGPATRHILQREYEHYGNKEYERLAKISVAHLYNLRASARYRNQVAVFEATQPAATAIGERRRPAPQPLANPADAAGLAHFHRQGMHRLEKWKTEKRFPTFPPGARDDDGLPLL